MPVVDGPGRAQWRASTGWNKLMERTVTNSTHHCRICDGVRPNNGTICLGCGTALVRCQVATPKKSLHCPTCGRGKSVTVMEAGRFRCLKCNVVFEREDFGFLDDRPDVNLEKKERADQQMKREKAKGRR